MRMFAPLFQIKATPCLSIQLCVWVNQPKQTQYNFFFLTYNLSKAVYSDSATFVLGNIFFIASAFSCILPLFLSPSILSYTSLSHHKLSLSLSFLHAVRPNTLLPVYLAALVRVPSLTVTPHSLQTLLYIFLCHCVLFQFLPSHLTLFLPSSYNSLPFLWITSSNTVLQRFTLSLTHSVSPFHRHLP